MNYLRLLQLRRMMDADGKGGGTPAPIPDADTDGAPKTFDDILADKAYRSEYDRRVSKALETAKSKWEAVKAAEIKAAEDAATARAKMSADEKAKADAEKAASDLAKREADITRRELRAHAQEVLTSKDMPKELADTITYTDAAACDAALEALEKAFKAAVESGVNGRLRQPPPPAGAGKPTQPQSLGDAVAQALADQQKGK